MGQVFAEITVTNKEDMFKAKNGIITEKDIRSVTIKALVDTGATTLVINNEICSQLGLDIVDTRSVNLAGGGKGLCHVTEPVQNFSIYFP
jgi:predicted aspartyl protease